MVKDFVNTKAPGRRSSFNIFTVSLCLFGKRAISVSCLLLIANVLSAQSKYDTLPNLPEHYNLRLEQFRKEPIVIGKIMFVGNSVTEGGNWRKLLKDSTVINRGIGGDNTFGLLRRLDDIAKRKPSVIFIMIGINDLSKNIPNAVIIENIFSIVSQIKSASPKTRIMLQSLLPVNPTVKNFPVAFSKQDDIITINGQLGKYSDVLKYTFVDLHGQFTDAKGMLDPSLTNDGLHLNTSGYIRWVEFLKKSKYL